MRIERVYGLALRLFPADYRARFSAEMQLAFAEAAGDHRGAGTMVWVRFALAELTSLISGIATEWLAKLTSDGAVRGRCLPDCRMMRPVGVTRGEWAGGLDAADIHHGPGHGEPTAH